MAPFSCEFPTGTRFIVISQDCDVASGDTEAEPAVEVIAVVPIEDIDPLCRHLKDPRELHILLSEGTTNVPASASPWRRGFVDRGLLLEHGPDETMKVIEDEISVLIDFVDRRYTRVALPDEFNRRFEPAKKKIRELLTPYVEQIVDLYVRIKPFEELPRLPQQQAGEDLSSISYSLTVYIFVSNDIVDYDETTLKRIRGSLKPPITALIRRRRGIDLEDVVVDGLDAITARQLRELRVLDFESFSLANQEGSNETP
jgi:hypothetical protein